MYPTDSLTSNDAFIKALAPDCENIISGIAARNEVTRRIRMVIQLKLFQKTDDNKSACYFYEKQQCKGEWNTPSSHLKILSQLCRQVATSPETQKELESKCLEQYQTVWTAFVKNQKEHVGKFFVDHLTKYWAHLIESSKKWSDKGPKSYVECDMTLTVVAMKIDTHEVVPTQTIQRVYTIYDRTLCARVEN